MVAQPRVQPGDLITYIPVEGEVVDVCVLVVKPCDRGNLPTVTAAS